MLLPFSMLVALTRNPPEPDVTSVELDLPAPHGPCLTLYLLRDEAFCPGPWPARGDAVGGLECGAIDMAGKPLAYLVVREAQAGQVVTCEVAGVSIRARLGPPESPPSQAAWQFEYADAKDWTQCTRESVNVGLRSPPAPEPADAPAAPP